jgi:hypothetical protein
MQHHLTEMFLSNQVSGPEIREMFEDAVVLGVPGASRSAKAGTHGKHKHNVKRDMLRHSLKGKKDWPPLYFIDVEIMNPATQTVGIKKLPLILPHEVVFFLAKRNAKEALLREECMAQCTRRHLEAARRELNVEELVGIGLWGDGVPCKFDRSESIECLTMNLPGPPAAVNMRIPVTVINKKFLVKSITWDTVFTTLAWSFSVLASGSMPGIDHLGNPMIGARAKWAGKPLMKGILAEFRGDWAWYKACFRYPQHNEKIGICWRCNCTPKTLREVGVDASWRGGTLTHWQLLQRMVDQGLTPSPLFASPCFRSTAVLIDWLHVADQGILLHFLASIFKFILPKLGGANSTEQCRALWLEVQVFYRSNPVDSKLDNLTVSMLGAKNKPPKLRARAAEARGLVAFSVLLVQKYLSHANELESSIIHCTNYLSNCYANLSPAQFSAASLKDASRKFALLYVTLEQLFNNRLRWHVTPKLHLFQELCEECSTCPSLSWVYRDEDMGGTLMGLGRRRGGSNNITTTACSVLNRFIANNRMPSLES